MKALLKQFIPPIIARRFKFNSSSKDEIYFKGRFKTWTEACSKSDGYDATIILENCKAAMIKVKNGESAFERDSCLFDEIQYSWGVLACLQKIAMERNKELCVLDFGGSLGSSYYQNRSFLKGIKLDWCIVEQSHFVACGQEHFSTQELHFFYTVEECLLKFNPDVILLSGVLQYLEEPTKWISKFMMLDVKHLIVDRCVLSKDEFITIQHVPTTIYKASYPVWIFSINKFPTLFKKKFKTIIEFPTIDNSPQEIEGTPVLYKGFFMI